MSSGQHIQVGSAFCVNAFERRSWTGSAGAPPAMACALAGHIGFFDLPVPFTLHANTESNRRGRQSAHAAARVLPGTMRAVRGICASDCLFVQLCDSLVNSPRQAGCPSHAGEAA